MVIVSFFYIDTLLESKAMFEIIVFIDITLHSKICHYVIKFVIDLRQVSGFLHE